MDSGGKLVVLVRICSAVVVATRRGDELCLRRVVVERKPAVPLDQAPAIRLLRKD